MIERHFMKLRARGDLSQAEEQAIREAVLEVREVAADTVMVSAGEPLSQSLLLLDGMMARYKDLRDGGRQVTELHVAGDFADLHGFTLKRLDHDVKTLGACRVAIVPHDRLRRITEQHPHLTRLYWFGTNLDAAIHREWAVSLGRRSAYGRMAHLFCELHARLEIVGLADADGYDLPLSQVELAECLGISAVHVNRTLMQLRADDLVEFRGGRVTIRQPAALRAAAEFDPAYLYLERQPE